MTRAAGRRVVCASVVAVTIAGGLMVPATAQRAADRFEFISIRRVAECEHWDPLVPDCREPSDLPTPGFQVTRDGRFEARNKTLFELVRFAYGFADRDSKLVSGGPRWTKGHRYDVVGVPGVNGRSSDAAALAAATRARLQSLLTTRFSLRVRTTDESIKVLELQIAKGLRSPLLRRTSGLCAGPFVVVPGDTRPRCEMRSDFRIVAAGDVSMPDIARLLGHGLNVNELVVDGTDLSGRFDFVARVTERGSVPLAFRKALREQTGLELRSTHRPVERLIIEDARQPELD